MAEKMHEVAQLQAELGLPRTDAHKTRQNVRLLFTVYRQYRDHFVHGKELELEPIPELEKFADCEDPDHIRALNKPSSGVRPPDERELMMQKFMRDLEQKVKRLKPLQREILQRKFMSDYDELSDFDVIEGMLNDGLDINDSQYARTKQAAMLRIGAYMHVTAFHSE